MRTITAAGSDDLTGYVGSPVARVTVAFDEADRWLSEWINATEEAA